MSPIRIEIWSRNSLPQYLSTLVLILKPVWLAQCLLGYLKTRIGWGEGGKFYSLPSKSHVWCPNMTIDTSFGKTLLLESAKNCKFAKINFFAESSYKVQILQNKIVQKMMPLKICKKLWTIFNILVCNLKKLKMCQFLCKYFANISLQNLCNPFLYVIGFPKS